MFCDVDRFRPKALHFYDVKELSIEVRRRNWRQEELDKRREQFSSQRGNT